MRTELSIFLSEAGRTQESLARAIGITQGAVFQMLKSNRAIFVIEKEDGSLELEEVKRISGVA